MIGVFAESAARTMFVMEWASVHGDGLDVELMDVAPPTPEGWVLDGYRFIGALEEANGANILAIIAAARASGSELLCRELGHCLVMEALGEGVSWNDNHNPIVMFRGRGLALPDFAYYTDLDD